MTEKPELRRLTLTPDVPVKSKFSLAEMIKSQFPNADKESYAKLTDEEKKKVDKEISAFFLNQSFETLSKVLSKHTLNNANTKELIQISQMLLEEHRKFEGKNEINVNVTHDLRNLIQATTRESFKDVEIVIDESSTSNPAK